MTPATAPAIVVEYHFRCFCGAPIVTTEKTVTCATCGETLGHYASILPVCRIEKPKQQPVNSSYAGSLGRSTQTRYATNDWPRMALYRGVHVKVRSTRPDGKPHPHAGKTGRITRFIDLFSDPYWRGLPSAMIKLGSGITPQGFIWVSNECLEALAEDR
jgi:hypothetical protein